MVAAAPLGSTTAVTTSSRVCRPRAPAGDSHEHRPAWRFSHCDGDGPWPWNWDSVLVHFDKLVQLEGRTWPDITGKGAIGAKRIPLANLCKAAQRRLEQVLVDDTDALWELGLGGKPRLWGLRVGSCFHFLWWDPEHEVCPSAKK